MAFDLSKVGQLEPVLGTDKTADLSAPAPIRIETPAPTSLCLGTIDGKQILGDAVVCSALIKTKLNGLARLHLSIETEGGKYAQARSMTALGGEAGWRLIRLLCALDEAPAPTRLFLNLDILGRGELWVREVRVTFHDQHAGAEPAGADPAGRGPAQP